VSPLWRLLIDGEATGPWNMGVDEALLATAVANGRPTLRFYRWQGPWLSLGYAQRASAHRLAVCAEQGVGVVRRVTGGRAVLHGEDLTYAVAAPAGLLPPGLGGSYERLGSAVRAALRELGVAAEPPSASPGSPHVGFDCFGTAAGHELCVAGRKLVGSAQRRGGGGVLQHGSIRLSPDPAGARHAAGLDAGVATSLREVGCERSAEQVIGACVAAFSRVLAIRLAPGRLDPSEAERAARRLGEPEAAPDGGPRMPHGAPQECISPADR